MINPVISIIIVTYNAEKHLNECLDSIVKHGTNELRIIIIDGESTDGTIGIIKSREASIQFWKSEPDHGIYDAMNKGLSYVEDGWVLFLGADDVLESGFTAMLPELQDPQTVYYGMVDVNKVIYKGPYSNYRLAKLNICHQAIFYPVSAFKKYQYNLRYKICADWLLNMQCWKDRDFRFIYKPFLITTFGTEGLSSTSRDLIFETQRHKIVLRHLGFLTSMRLRFREAKRNIWS
jgi:GT2 family glycosyltransferase